ncbi:hypothetical protein M434DRAFT_25137 [Hypoxylon sp. CO27-5]|nr:hypothetical protein M434DRAFT_25137 [Hypoxylon sp. CO27-5]
MTTISILFITIGPSGPHTHTVVFLHGRGDNARNFAAWLAHWRDTRHRTLKDAFPSFRWVFPQAPTRKCASTPDISWPQWFDVWDVRDFGVNEGLQSVGPKEVDRVVLAGISMGGATAAHGGRLAAFIGFSCRCPFPGRSLVEMRNVLDLENVPDHSHVVQNTPVLFELCADDPLVLVQNGRGLRETLRGFGAQVEWKKYPTEGIGSIRRLVWMMLWTF